MKRRILVAEDEASIRINLVRLLGLEGYEVLAAEDGAQAWQLVREQQPELVLSDVMMPHMTGHALLQCMRADPLTAHIPAVLLTAKADRGDVREGMNLGADDYLTKPFQRDELLQCIQAQLAKADTRQFAASRAAEQAHHLAYYDALTDLPNRTHFLLLLAHALALQAGREGAVGLWVIGIDDAARLAQAMGSGTFDACTQALARRLAALAGQAPWAAGAAQPGLVARVAGDALALLSVALPEGSQQQGGAEALALQLHTHLAQPLRLGGAASADASGEASDATGASHATGATDATGAAGTPGATGADGGEEHFLKLSVGACGSVSRGDRADELLSRAEMALADARAHPGRPAVVFSPGAGSAVSVGFRLHNDLHRALARQQLAVFFQPQVRAADGRPVGFEALMRWRHPELGLVRPDQFIPIAEANGQIVPMGAWILHQACLEAQRWQAHWPPDRAPLRVAVNLSLRQFGDPRLIDQVRSALKASGLPPARLELEITESTAMLELQHTLEVLRQLKALGIALAVDDFGTGYSSLAYLKRFPLDVLKIDQSFVRNLGSDAEDEAIARSVVHLAHSLGLSVIAEGVETAAQHALLQAMGCDEMQGWLHGRPLPADAVADWLATAA